MKRFKTKKKHYIIKSIMLFIITIFSMIFTFNICVKYFGSKVDMKKLSKYLIKEGFNNQINKLNIYNPLDITEPLQLIQSNLNFKYINNKLDIVDTLETSKEDINSPYAEYKIYQDIENGKRIKAKQEEDQWNHYQLIKDFEREHLILNPTNKDDNLYQEVRLEFFQNAIEKGQVKSKRRLLEKYPRL